MPAAKYRVMTLVLKANEERSIPIPTDYVALISATDVDNVTVRFDEEGAASQLIVGLIPDRVDAPRFWIGDTSGAPNTVRIAIGGGASVQDNRQLMSLVSQIVDVRKINNASPVGAKATAAALCASIATDDPLAVQVGHNLPADRWNVPAAAGGILNTVVPVVLKAVVAAKSHYVTGVQISAEALTNATELVIQETGGAAVLWRYKIPAAAAQGLVSIAFPSPLKATAATAIEVATLTASGAGAVYANVQGYTK